jgi:hypothetical protein
LGAKASQKATQKSPENWLRRTEIREIHNHEKNHVLEDGINVGTGKKAIKKEDRLRKSGRRVQKENNNGLKKAFRHEIAKGGNRSECCEERNDEDIDFGKWLGTDRGVNSRKSERDYRRFLRKISSRKTFKKRSHIREMVSWELAIIAQERCPEPGRWMRGRFVHRPADSIVKRLRDVCDGQGNGY